MNMDSDLVISSPDPLGQSNENIGTPSPTKTPTKRQRLSITPRKPLTDTSGNAKTQDFYLTTPPARSGSSSPIKLSKHKDEAQSPWRIRLTVQAERVDDGNQEVSSILLTERTTTTRVPLKGGDDPSPNVKRSRGRPRKSIDSPFKRNGTPKPKGAGRLMTMHDSPGRSGSRGIKSPTPTKKGRGKGRKNLEFGSRGFETEGGFGSSSNSNSVYTTKQQKDGKAARSRSRSRRKEITPKKMALESESGSEMSALLTQIDEQHQDQFLNYDSSISDPSNLASSQCVLREMASVKAGGHNALAAEQTTAQSNLKMGDEAMWRSIIREDSRSLSPTKTAQQQPADLDPTDDHQEYDTILESEGFSMVSVESIPSMASHSGNTADDVDRRMSSSLASKSAMDSRDSLNPPEPSREASSTHKQHSSIKERTPEITSSLSVPPAPQANKPPSSPRELNKKGDGTPEIVRVTRAGTALQDVLGPANHRPDLRNPHLSSPFHSSEKPSPFLTSPVAKPENAQHVYAGRSGKIAMDNAFTGFGQGTRRELRAGLRLGEELAKKQTKLSDDNDDPLSNNDIVSQHATKVAYPRLRSAASKISSNLDISERAEQVTYPNFTNEQLPSPETSDTDLNEDRMSWKANKPMKAEEPTLPTAALLVDDDTPAPDASIIDNTMLAREAQWQQERDAVSKRIDEAPSSQVIVIDSDDEDFHLETYMYEQDSTDVLQAQDRSANTSQQPGNEDGSLLPQPSLPKPRRSKIPSPWRRGRRAFSSDVAENTESDLFWQPDQAQGRATRRRQERKKRELESLSGSSLAHESSSKIVEEKHTSELVTDRLASLHHNPSDNAAQKSRKIQLKDLNFEPELSEVADISQSSINGSSTSQEQSPAQAALERSSAASEAFSRHATRESEFTCPERLARHSQLAGPESDSALSVSEDLPQSSISDSSVTEEQSPALPAKSPRDAIREYQQETLRKAALLNKPKETKPLDDTRDRIQPIDELLATETAVKVAPHKPKTKPKPQRHAKPPMIDPQLLHLGPEKPPPTLPIIPEPTSWLSVLAAPITNLFTPSPPALPPATKSDILTSSPHEPLPIHHPWQPSHTRALSAFYHASHFYGAFIFPYNSRSRSARHLGYNITTSRGWSRKVTKADCGIADAFWVLLQARGVIDRDAVGEGERLDINEGDIVYKCVTLWAEMVMRGEVAVDKGRGEAVGLRRQGDRMWSVGDVEWEENHSGYFERKKREFELQGLPSWREKGLMPGVE